MSSLKRHGAHEVAQFMPKGMQEAGTATLSDTTLLGRHSLRVAIANHRTRRADLDLLVGEVLRVGAELQRR